MVRPSAAAAPADAEILRLRELLPASGRMWIDIMPTAGLGTAIASPFPYPWQRRRRIEINVALWLTMPRPQRDLLMLRQCCWLMGVRWFVPNWYQAVMVLGLVNGAIELGQADALGVLVSGGLVGVAGAQVWRLNRRSEREIEADREAIVTARRRGYDREAAARHLLDGIEAAARLAGRPGLEFNEVLRCQHLRSQLAGGNRGAP